jgi:DNA-binding CsgD family transcriptional regulator
MACVSESPELLRGREAYGRRAWRDAFLALSEADGLAPLSAADLELLARAAYMLGRDDDYAAGLERALHLHVDAGDLRPAVRCAFWLGHSMLFRGEPARAMGWFGRAERLCEQADDDCVERGYLLIPIWLDQMNKHDWEAAFATACEGAAIGERFGDADLEWMARDEQGRALVRQGRVAEALRLVNEVLVVANAGELSPIVTGIVYCNTIGFVHEVYELRHAGEWTDALTTWCDAQPQMVAHNGLCLLHQAEVFQLRGAWAEALDQAKYAAERFTTGVLNQMAAGRAVYRQAEVQRLRGELEAAEQTYRDASRRGCEPQPGLALLRLAQGEQQTAAAAIRRFVGERVDPIERVGFLPAYVEIMLATGELDRAAAACRELEEIAERQGSETLGAMAGQARGAVALAEGDADGALAALRRAFTVWQELAAPYEAAVTRVLIGLACRALGDEDTARLELDGAREAFERLGAAPDVARVDALVSGAVASGDSGLTARELEVLRLVAAGRTNREIASALTISEHTVARHIQNIFAKLGVTSRTAASAFAFEHDLV